MASRKLTRRYHYVAAHESERIKGLIRQCYPSIRIYEESEMARVTCWQLEGLAKEVDACKEHLRVLAENERPTPEYLEALIAAKSCS